MKRMVHGTNYTNVSYIIDVWFADGKAGDGKYTAKKPLFNLLKSFFVLLYNNGESLIL